MRPSKKLGRYLLAALLVLPTSFVFSDMPEIPRGKGEACVEPTDVMRKKHMEFLHHDRDLTMRQGNRNIKHSLNQCVECHAQTDEKGEYLSINASGQFCAVCHEYASVKIDCFECHATRPDKGYSFNAPEAGDLADLIAKELAKPAGEQNL